MNMLFKNFTLNGEATDLYLKDGVSCEPTEGEAFEVVDCTGLTAIPTLLDLHVHLRDPGFTYKETVETGTLAARNGGFGGVFAMPNTKPACDNPETIKYILSQNKHVDVYPVAAITKGLGGKELTDFHELKEAGAKAFSDDGMPVEDTELFMKALKSANEVGLPVFAHCEMKAHVKDRLNIPNAAEWEGVKRELMAAHKTGCPVHLCHISTRQSVQFIRDAKRSGIQVTAETCPHYFTLTRDAVKEKGSYAMMNPPLCDEADVEAIKEAIADGTIDVISTDHAPHSIEDKSGPLESVPFGITGLESSFALSYTNLVKTGIITLEELIDMMCLKPREIAGLPYIPFTRKGAKPNLVLVDLNNEFVFNSSKSLSMSRNTPFDGEVLNGAIKYNILRGDIFTCQQMYL